MLDYIYIFWVWCYIIGEDDIILPKEVNMKRFRFLALVIAIITICSTIAFVGCNNNNTLPQETDKALVSLNINPSIEMVVDSEDRVVSIAAKNEDAQIMLCGEEGLINASVESATTKIVDLAIEYGYITDDNSGISVSVAGETTTLEDSIETKVTAAIGNVKTDISLNISTDVPFSVARKWEEWKQNNPELAEVTASKFALALGACAYDASLDLETAVSMDNGELIEICESGENRISVYATAAYQAVYDSASVAFDLAKDTANFGIFNAKYIEMMTAKASGLDKVSAAANATWMGTKLLGLTTAQYALQGAIYIAEQIGELEVSATVASDIATILGVEVEELQNQDGKVTVESIDAYCDKLVKNASEADKQVVLAKLEQIKAGLSAAEEQAEQAMMEDDASAYGNLKVAVEKLGDWIEGIDVNKLTDVDSYKALLADVIKAKEDTKIAMDGNLTDEEKAEIANAQADAKATIDQAQADFNAKIEQAKDEAIAYLQANQQERKAAMA